MSENTTPSSEETSLQAPVQALLEGQSFVAIPAEVLNLLQIQAVTLNNQSGVIHSQTQIIAQLVAQQNAEHEAVSTRISAGKLKGPLGFQTPAQRAAQAAPARAEQQTVQRN